MIKRNNKKGFTIVELVIVIAVIAILAAVLIPTFAGIIKKANLSADMQAVRQMNVALAADGAVTPTDIFNLHEVLEENGMTSEDYHPLTNDTYFFWDADLNRVLHVDKDMIVIAPEEYKGQAYSSASKWYSLSLEIMEEKVDINKDSGIATVAVKNGAQMQYVLKTIAKDKNATSYTINVNGTVDMMGAAFAIPKGHDITISGADDKAVIKNATAVEYARKATETTNGNNGVYGCAMIPVVDKNVVIENITIENMNVKNTDVSGAALLIGQLNAGASATISNVTINNSSIIAHRSVGALIGSIKGEATLNNIELNNVAVKTVGGRGGLLVGAVEVAQDKITANDITVTNCSYGIYECAQNSGTFNGKDLGLKDGLMTSTCETSTGTSTKLLDYVANALAMKNTGDKRDGEDIFVDYTGFDAAVSGWN